MAGKKKPRTKSIDGLTAFEMIFSGEYVELHTDLPYMESQDSGEERYSISTYINEQGYMLDMDEFNYYMGDTPDSVTKAIPKHRVFKVQLGKLVQPRSKADIILDSMDPSEFTEN